MLRIDVIFFSVCFKIFDLDRDSALNKKELVHMVSVLTLVANELLKYESSRSSTPSEGTDSDPLEKLHDVDVVLLNLRDKLVTKEGGCKKPMFHLGPTSIDALENEQIELSPKHLATENESVDIIGDDMALTQEDFLIWSVETAEALVTPFLDLIFEVCHIVLGLRPQCKHQERDIGKIL